MKKTLVIVLSLSALALAKSAVSIDLNSYQEISKKDKSGKVVKVWSKVTKVVPKTTIKYVDTITNSSTETIKNVKVTNPIDKNLIFLKGSVKSKAKFSVKYSVDGGKSFKEPSKLFIKSKDGKKVLATAKDYNALLVNINEIPANSKVKVEYKVKVK
jgi:uncharacterized repeat protein (TIGR01451 family)